MVLKTKKMNLLDFNNRFPTEGSCRVYLAEKREQEGIVCKKCGGTKHYWIENQSLWRCANCRSCTNLRAGTIMEKSHLPVKTWFMCIHLLTSTKKSFSALEMQRQLGMKRYEPVWYMMQKIRKSMGKRDNRYQLKGTIECDDAFFEIVDIPEKDELGNRKNNDEVQKRGRGSKKQMKVLVMVESTFNPLQNNPHKKNRVMGFVKMVIMDDLTSIGVNYEVSQAVDKNSTVITDGYRSLSKLNKVVKNHIQKVVPSKKAHKALPWVHTVISNAKRLFLGVHHSISKDYLQNYLNEYCYKLNRRNFTSDLFDRMIIAGANDTWY
jgi:ISXO2-like transposase domain/Transposase zinc-ribbon domain